MAGGPNMLGNGCASCASRRGASISVIATEIGVNRRYLWLLELHPQDGERGSMKAGPEAPQPARDLIIRIAFALGLYDRHDGRTALDRPLCPAVSTATASHVMRLDFTVRGVCWMDILARQKVAMQHHP